MMRLNRSARRLGEPSRISFRRWRACGRYFAGRDRSEILDGVKDPVTLANYNANKVAIGGGIGADHVADLILNAYNPPQNVLVQEICITLTRQKY
jgi:hypothetical protein